MNFVNNMNKSFRQHNPLLLKLISVLLLYPDDEFMDALPLLEAEISNSVKGSTKNQLLAFVKNAKTIPAIQLQEHYTQVFDVNPRTCLNLTYHSIGDTENRGRVLAQIDQIYLESGYERTTSELPDFLPLILEFLSQSHQDTQLDLLWKQLEAVKNIAETLGKIGSPYQALMEILLENYNNA